MIEERYNDVLDHLKESYPGKARLSVAETASALGIARQTLYNALYTSTLAIRPVYIGRRPGFLVTDIARHLAGEGGI